MLRAGPGLGSTPSPAARPLPAPGDPHGIEQRPVPAQTFLMGDRHGDDRYGDGESPIHEVTLAAFHIDATTVTNRC